MYHLPSNSSHDLTTPPILNKSQHLYHISSAQLQGVKTPDSILEISCMTPKDREDLKYMLGIGVDWVALSFVQRPEDIVEIKRLIMDWNPENAFPPHVMAKIEKPSCFEGDNLKDIVELCDGIMVARGDLGVECAPEDVPILQKIIIDECRGQGKPVVVATQVSLAFGELVLPFVINCSRFT